MSVMKELSAHWIVSACDHIRSHAEIITNGFKKAGIVDAIAHPVTIQVMSTGSELQVADDDDPL